MTYKNIIEIVILSLVMIFVIGCIESDDKNINESASMTKIATGPVITPDITDDTTITADATIEPEDTAEPNVTITPIVTTETNTTTNTGQYNILTHTFKINDEKTMFGIDIRLIDLATEEGTAIVNIDGEQYNLTYVEKNIKNRIVKIISMNGIDQTVDIMVKYGT